MNETHFQLARLIEVGRHRDAEQILQRELAIRPNDPDLHWLAARTTALQNDLGRAEEHVDQALAADPHHFGARLMAYAICLEKNRLPRAEQIIVDLIREYPGEATLFAYYAELQMRALDVKKARALLDEALRLDANDAHARRVEILLLTVEGRAKDASEQLADLIRDDPEAHSSARTLFFVLIQQGRHHEAFEIGRQLLRVDPENQGLVEALAELRVSTHWIAIPAYPLRRFGWAGSAAVWGIAVFGLQAAVAWDPFWGSVLVAVYLVWVVYTWTYPSILKRWLLRRGF